MTIKLYVKAYDLEICKYGDHDIEYGIDVINSCKEITYISIKGGSQAEIMSLFPKYCKAKPSKLGKLIDGSLISEDIVCFDFNGENPLASKRIKKILTVLGELK